MQLSFTSKAIIEAVKPVSTKGGTTAMLTGLATLSEAREGDLSFLGNPKYKVEVPGCQASAILVPVGYEGEPRENQLLLFVENPSATLAMLCERLEQAMWPRPVAGVHKTAVISKKAKLGKGVHVGAFCVIEEGAEIGENCVVEAQGFIGRNVKIGKDGWLMARVTVGTGSVVGERVRMLPGVVVGADGFGYEFVEGRHKKVPQVGNVVIGDDVEIGSNTTIDRARFGSTQIGEGTKIDNLVQIGHNVRIGKHCLLCGQVGIAGSTVVEDYVVLGGQVGVSGHLRLGKGFKAGAQTGIASSQAAGTAAMGTPSMPYMTAQKVAVLQPRLPELFKRMGDVEKALGIEKKTFSN